MIAILVERDFEIKVADRLDNLDDLDWITLSYIKKNLVSTEVYIRKAKTFQRNDLIEFLMDGLVKLQKRKQELLIQS